MPMILRLAPLSLLACASTTAPSPAEAFPWLAGTWAYEADGIRTEEAWRVAPNGDLIGTGHAKGGRVLLFSEHLTIQPVDGVPTYVAWPIGAEPVAFPMVSQGPSRASFANPEHDFPQQLTYTRSGGGTLDVVAVGVGADGAERREAWTLSPATP